jgi:PAS domain S-box-containing protein
VQLTTTASHTLQSLTNRRSRRFVVIVMLLLGVLVSGLGARAITQAEQARLQGLLDSNAAIVRSRVAQKTNAAVDILESVRPLWQMRTAPSDADFKRYVRTGLAQARGGRTTYAGLTDIAFVRHVPADGTQPFVRSVRAERPQRYALDLAGDRPHYVVDFHTSDSVVGTDLYTLPRRREALEAARDGGTAAASRWYVTVADLGLPIEDQRKLTLIAVPVYEGGRTPTTVARRRANLIGWLTAPLFAGEVLDDVAADLPVNLELYDPPASTVPTAAVDRGGTAGLDPLRVEVLGREWDMRIGLAEELADRTVPRATAVLIAGVCLTLLLTALYWLTSRLGALSESRASTASARLREHESYVRVIAERVPVGIADLDADGRILWANTQLAELVDLDVDHLVGLPWSEIVHPDDRETVRTAHVTAVADGEAFSVRHRLHGAGDDRWIERAGAPTLDDAGNVIRVVAVVSDVSATVEFEDRLRVARDRAVEALRMKSEFLANMSHEIRTPLNGVIGMADVLSATELSDAHRSRLSTLRIAATQLQDLLTDLLELSKIEAGRLELDDVEFDLPETIDSLVRIHASEAFGRMLELRVDLDDALPARVRGSKLRLRQVLATLLGNAVACTHHGEVGLSAKVVAHRSGMTHVRFDVTDTGIGVSAAVIESVFDPFAQAHALDARVHGGSGLGLAISRQLVEMMGGRLGVESTTNRGSRFTFTVPFEAVQDAAPTPEAEAGGRAPVPVVEVSAAVDIAPSTPRGAGARVGTAPLLVVEDNPINQEVARELLATLGYAAEVVRDGAAGVEAVRNGRFAAVLMDCQMPVMDGYEATARIRELESAEARHTPIIAMTASAMAGDRQRCLAAGMDDYISKPVSADVLAETLARWVGARAPAAGAGDAAGDDHAAQAPVLDWQVLDQLSAVPGLLEQSRTRFLESAHDEISAMRQLIEAGDLTGLRAAAHTLRGASLTLGALRLGEHLQHVEDASAAAPDAVAAVFEAVVASFAELREALLATDTAP